MSTGPDDEAAGGAMARGGDGTTAVLQAMLTTFSDVLAALDDRMATMESSMLSLQRDQERAAELDQAMHRLDRIDAIEADLTAMHGALLDHPATTVYDAVAHLGRQVDSLVAQPGPGPAMAMVAAGLSERFEQRTQGLVELLEEHAELMHALTEQVQGAMQGLVSAVESRQAGLDRLLDTVRAVAHTIEGMGVRVEETREGVDAVFRAGEDLPAVVRSLRELDDDIRVTAEVIESGSVAGVNRVVRHETELLGQQIAALSVSLDSIRELLGAHVEDSSQTLGRKASDVGRRLVAELGLSAKAKAKPPAPVSHRTPGPSTDPIATRPPPPPPRPLPPPSKPRATKKRTPPSPVPPRKRARKPGPKP